MDLKKKMKRTENILAVAVLTAVLAVGFLIVFGRLRSYSVKVCLQALEEETQEAKNDICRQLASLQDHLEMLADLIGQEGLSDHRQTAKILQACGDLDLISRLGILLPDDRILQPDGTLADYLVRLYQFLKMQV